MVDQPTKGTLYGSVVAAPYVGNVMATILPYLGVEAVYTDAELAKKAVETPGVIWWTVDAARVYAEGMGFELEVIGDGDLIYAQSPAAGVQVEQEGAKLIVYTDRSAEKKTVKVPDLTGKTTVASSGLLASSNLNIKIIGTYNYTSGTAATAYAQSIEPGTVVEIGTTITVYFRDENVADDVENPNLPELNP
jgi:stage V sporulation protein D (sporulation-specific penicillin-binding protein)